MPSVIEGERHEQKWKLAEHLVGKVANLLNEDERSLLLQYVIICATLVIADLIIMAGYTGLASRIMKYMRNPHRAAALNRLFGILFIMAALLMAFMGQKV